MSRRRKRRREAQPKPPPVPRRLDGLAARLSQVFGAPWFLPALIVIGAVLRVAHLVALSSSPFRASLQLDHLAYDEWGRRIASGDWMGSEVFFVDPLYAYFLGAVYAAFGHDLLVVRIVQLLLGLATVWLTARIGARVLGSTALGNLAALLVALFIPAVHYEAALEKTALSVFLFTLAVDLYLRLSSAAALLSGFALGLAALARGNLLLFLPVGALGLLFEGRRGALSWRRCGLFMAGGLAVIGVTAARNLAVSGDLVLTSANLGQNLYIGQHRGNVTGVYHPPPFVRPDPRYEEADFRAEAERRAGHALSAREASSYWLGRAMDEVAAAPAAALDRTWRKLRLFWHQYETPDNDNIELIAEYSLALRLPLVGMGVLFPLAVLGVATGWRRNRNVRVLASAAALYCGAVVSFFVLARFRAPIVPILAVLAAGGLAWLGDAARAAAWRRLIWGAALVAGAAVWACTYPAWLDAQRRRSLAIAHNNLGTSFYDAGDFDSAIRSYERAVASDPQSVIASMRALGDLYLRRADYVRAERHMRRVLELKPGSRLGLDALARLYGAMLADPRTRNSPGLARKLAETNRALGRPAEGGL